MVCIKEFKLSPAVVLYNRMQLIRKGLRISFHDLDPSDIASMKDMVEELDHRHPNQGMYLMVLRILIASEEISNEYNRYNVHLDWCVRRQPFYGWKLNQAPIIDSVMHIPLSLPEHRNKYRAVQVAFKVAYNESLSN